jgi:propionyl-CoA carboxylase alpha chain
MYYDPMLAKLVTHGRDRADAIDRMALALDRFQVEGIRHNMTFLAAVNGHARFQSGNISTAFIEDEFPDGFAEDALAAECIDRLAPIIAARHAFLREREVDGPHDHDYVVLAADYSRKVKVNFSVDSTYVLMGGREIHIVGDLDPTTALFDGTIDGIDTAVQIQRDGPGYGLTHGGVN